ncbi:hypothetical protein PS664_01878 [Pseudomonas fluorescens]|nr:hypothetical protein PS664_01878 [Pseudomonas fluorescens]
MWEGACPRDGLADNQASLGVLRPIAIGGKPPPTFDWCYQDYWLLAASNLLHQFSMSFCIIRP